MLLIISVNFLIVKKFLGNIPSFLRGRFLVERIRELCEGQGKTLFFLEKNVDLETEP